MLEMFEISNKGQGVGSQPEVMIALFLLTTWNPQDLSMLVFIVTLHLLLSPSYGLSLQTIDKIFSSICLGYIDLRGTPDRVWWQYPWWSVFQYTSATDDLQFGPENWPVP